MFIRFPMLAMFKNCYNFSSRNLVTKINQDLIGILDEQSQQQFLMKVNASKQQPLSHIRLSKEILTTTTATVKNSTETLRKSGDSAVLIPLVEMEDRTPWIIMTHRSYTLRAHRGEICFPGGKVEEDESSEKVNLFFCILI